MTKKAKIGFTSQAGTVIEVLLPQEVMRAWLGGAAEESARKAVGELLLNGADALDAVAAAARQMDEAAASASAALSAAIGVPVSLAIVGPDRLVVVELEAMQAVQQKATGHK